MNASELIGRIRTEQDLDLISVTLLAFAGTKRFAVHSKTVEKHR